MFEGPVTGNIPEVLDNGEVTDGTHVLALALTPYAQVADLAVNTAASGNNAAAIQSLDDQVTAELASKLDSSTLAPAISRLATAAALATTDGQAAAHGSSSAVLQSFLTTGLSNKADQSAFDALEGVVATKSTPDGGPEAVQLRLHRLRQQRHTGHGGLDIAARITPLDTKVANAVLGAVSAAALASKLASRDASISGLQASKADASALAAYALLSEVDSKIAAALLGAVTTAALDAALLGKADASTLASLLSTLDGWLAQPPTSWCTCHMSEADNVYDPLYGSFAGDQGAWSTAKMYFTVPPNRVAKLHFGAHFQALGLPNQTAGTVDVYGLILDATLEAGNTAEEDTAASPLLLKHEFLDGGADDVTLATLGEVLLEPTLTTLGNFLVRSPWPRPASRWEASERLRLEHRAHLHADAGETLLLRLPVPAGHGLQLGDVRQRGRQRLRGRHRHLPRHGLAGRLEHSAPGLLGAAGRNRTSKPSAALSPGWCSSRRARWTCTACRSGPAPSRRVGRTRWPSRARPRWTGSPRRATWAATSCCATT